MGGGLDGRPARQHPDLTANSPSRTAPTVRPALVLAVLALDGIISAILATFFLPLRIGGVPVPVSALLSGLLNAALVWAALHWTDSGRLAALPLWTWLGAVGVFTLGGPGGDIIFSSAGLGAFGVLILLVFGVIPPVAVLMRRTG